MNDSSMQSGPQVSDTERLDFIQRQNVKLESPSSVNPEFVVVLFGGAPSVQIFTGSTAREAIDAAMQSTIPGAHRKEVTSDPAREFQEYLKRNLKVGERRDTSDGGSGYEVWTGEQWEFRSR